MDSTQFNHQILSLSDKLFRLAKSILKDLEAAQDAVQDLSVKLWEKRSQLDDVENMPAFVLKAMRNLCLDTIRKQGKEVDLTDDIEFNELNPLQLVEQNDMVFRIKQLIENLPELQQTIIRMRDIEGFEIAQIAYITSITENAVSVNLSRARQKIREVLFQEQKHVNSKIYEQNERITR